MCKKIFHILIFISIPYLLLGQNLKSPAELMQMLNQSSLIYKIVGSTDDLDNESSGYLLSNRISLFKTDANSYIALDYLDVLKFDSLALYYYTLAQDCFAQKSYRQAVGFYKKILEYYPTISQIMAYMGQCYSLLNQNDSALYWYRKSIQNNYYDYLSHWLLSDFYYKNGNIKGAIYEVLLAHILNRNDGAIIKTANKYLNFANYRFISNNVRKPLSIKKSRNDSIIWCYFDFSEHPSWMSYLLYKALWRYEPGYREKMVKESDLPDFLLEEKECVFQMISSYFNIKNSGQEICQGTKDNGLVEKVLEASKSGYLNEMLLYELILPERPELVYYVNYDFLDRMIQYVWNHKVSRQLTALY